MISTRSKQYAILFWAYLANTIQTLFYLVFLFPFFYFFFLLTAMEKTYLYQPHYVIQQTGLEVQYNNLYGPYKNHGLVISFHRELQKTIFHQNFHEMGESHGKKIVNNTAF